MVGSPPFRQFVVKVHSRCNLACDHCYVYEHADQSWRSRPVVMRDETIRRTVERIAEHGREHRLPTVLVVFHGGEPLLAGKDRLRRFARLLREAVPPGCHLELGLQTNGLLIDEEFCELFLAERIRVGVSLDGDREANDRHRRFANGRSSYRAVVEAVRLLNQPRYRPVFSGLLCTIDPMNDPLAAYEALCALDPPAIDFLLPHATWEAPPARPGDRPTPYADWLLAIHERWRAERSPVRIRTFDAIGNLSAGGGSLTESLGLDDIDLAVVETDGAIEQADSLKTAYDGAPATGLNVHEHSFDDARHHPGFAARTGGADALCGTCQRCAVVDLCGGGLYAHRFHPGTGFANPSVYCPDLYRVVDHVRARPPVAGSPFVTHALAEDHFDALAAGGGDAGAIDALTTAQLSLRRARLAARLPDLPAADPHAEAIRAAWEALCDVDERVPTAVDRVLAHPYLGVWAARPADGVAATYLWGAALASSLLAGLPLQAKVPVTGGLLPLPGLGAVALPAVPPAAVRVVEIDPAAGAIAVDGHPLPVGDADDQDDGDRPVTAGPAWRALTPVPLCGSPVALDDVDPYRACFHRAATDRLDAAGRARWRDALVAADDTISRHFARHAPAVGRGLRVVTPLVVGDVDASATHRQAYGAVGIAETASPGELPDAVVLALLHEVQHLKMGAVLDLYDLFDASDERRFAVGWRPDERPIEGVLQGAYAHLAVVEVWRHRRDHAPGEAAAGAAAAHDELLDQTRAAIDTLLASGALTELGTRWVEHMRAGVCGTSR